MKLRLITALSILGIFGSFQAQQTNLYSLYNQNNYLINPAFTGANGCFNAFIDYRNQWVGVSNSPKTNTLTLDGRIKQKHGLGLNAKMNQAGLLANFDAKLSYAYFVSINAKTELSFGVSAGVIQQQFKAENAIATSYSDALLTQGGNNGLGFTSDLGIAVSHQKFKIGIAVPQAITSGLKLAYGLEETDFKLKQHIGVYANWSAIQNDKWNIAPFLNYRSSLQVGHQLDAGAHATWNKMIGIGAMYRTSYGIVGMIDLKIKDKVTLAYAYEFGNSSMINVSKGSHEIMLGITICKNKSQEEPKEVQEELVESNVEKEEKQDSITHSIPESIDSSDTVVNETIKEEEPEKPMDEVTNIAVTAPKQIDLDSLNKAFKISDKIIYFEFSSSTNDLSNNQEKVVTEVTKILTDNPEVKASIKGYTCNIGDKNFNQKLSKERAETIANAISKNGISKNRIYTKGEGSTTSSNDQSKNRKVVLQFTR